jgi:hypothetical protein
VPFQFDVLPQLLSVYTKQHIISLVSSLALYKIFGIRIDFVPITTSISGAVICSANNNLCY